MFCIDKEQELDEKMLQKMIEKFTLEVEPKLNKYKNYYDGLQEIANKSYNDSTKPCNRTCINFCRNIVNSYAGYLAAPNCISYSSQEDITDVLNILKYNNYQTEDANFLLDALVYGVAAELMYIDSESQVRFKLINPSQCFGVYDDSLTNDLLYFVRIYKASQWDDSDKYKVDVYDDSNIRHYEMKGKDGKVSLISEEQHYFSQCPANIFILQDEKSIFDCVLTQQDSYNELLSSEIDDFEAFCDAYLTLIGVDADTDDISTMKENRVLVLPEGASAAYLTKSPNDTQIENLLKRLQDSIYKIASCPDFSNENFVGGVSSGVAIKFKLSGLEQRAGIIESQMREALQRRIEVICGIASLKLGEEVYRDIQINFTRNIPEDNKTIIDLVKNLKGTVSDKTLLAQLPFVSNVETEIEALKTQNQENLALYDFGGGTAEPEEEE